MRRLYINNTKLKESKKMGQQDMYDNLCKRCYIRIMKPTKKEIKKMVMSEEEYQCECCHKTGSIVEYVED